MPLIHAFVMPHPPVIVPAVGNGREQEATATLDSCRRAAKRIAGDKPELIIFITPHGTVYDDYIHIAPGNGASGSFSRFGAPAESMSVTYDEAFIKTLCGRADSAGLPAGTQGGEKSSGLDHGVMVPLYFINRAYREFKVVCVSISGVSVEDHYRFGMCLRAAIEETGRRTVIVASGDLSHKLADDGPYGYAKEGPDFDRQITDAMRQGDFAAMMRFDPSFCEKAAECGLRSFIMMAGAFDGYDVQAELYSYESPFGVGYAVCEFFANKEDAYVRLARLTLEHFINTQKLPQIKDKMDSDMPREMLEKQAGTFVSLKKGGKLRGCIGTISPTRENIAEEIMYNAVSAGLNDSRFSPVTSEELPQLVYSVDVLSPPEQIDTMGMLDVSRYGVIVTSGHKRGLLLPNLDGVDTAEQQVSIALKKAGIKPTEKYAMERFEVVRHT